MIAQDNSKKEIKANQPERNIKAVFILGVICSTIGGFIGGFVSLWSYRVAPNKEIPVYEAFRVLNEAASPRRSASGFCTPSCLPISGV